MAVKNQILVLIRNHADLNNNKLYTQFWNYPNINEWNDIWNEYEDH